MTMTKTTSGGSKILVIGGTGTIGRHIVAASLEAGHPTLVLVRRSPAPAAAAAGVDPDKAKLLASLEASGATLVYGDMNDHESLVAAIKRADVVISAVGHRGTVELDGQLKVVDAIKEAGNIKRFVPSEYGCDVEQAEAATLEPARSIIAAKVRVREAVRAAAIPHTFICSYWAHGFMLPRLGDPLVDRPPATAAVVYGDDTQRAIFVDEKDMSAVAIRAVDDERALNKILYVRPAANKLSLGQLVRLWEKKSGSTLEKLYVSDQQLAKKVQESPFPVNFQLAMVHSTLVAGVCEQAINPAVGAEATELYPDMDFLTVDDYLDGLLSI
ncbi:isoflavone reductase homolog IRL-like [Oryza brachyantha]|uniref:isoflavone reductase homolog IRL-like n=1 Tax=Oryza brachyantha TaxID=4533 RepID=UPI001ADB4943|nr:isoflavone reductase homolog IRL-like [Oryza brachyantha]